MKFKLFNPSFDHSGIFLYHHANGKRFKYGLGVNVEVIHWNYDKQRARAVRGYHEESIDINDQLDNVETAFTVYLQDIKRNGKPISIDEIKYQVDVALGKIEPKKEDAEAEKNLSLVELSEEFLDENPYRLRKTTITAKRSSLKAIKQYNLNHKAQIDFQTIDLAMRTSFINYYEQHRIVKFKNGKIKDGPWKEHNTIWKYIKDLKSFLHYAEDEKGYQVNQAFKRDKFGISQKDVDAIYLRPEEIEKLEAVDLSKFSVGYQRTLDVFLIGCHTGLRYSDIVDLKPEHIKFNSKYTIDKIMIKPDMRVVIPVKKVIEHLILRLPLKTISNQKVNNLIKEIAELAKLDKALDISSHTARRSFATNAYRAGMKVLEIRQITGHKTESSFFRYLKITLEESAEEIGKHPFMQ